LNNTSQFFNRNILNKLSFILSISLIISSLQLKSQNLGNSPYSSLGLGELLPVGYSENQGMAGIGVASSMGIYVNNLNPALLARNKYTTFTMGLLGQNKTLKNSTLNQHSFSMNLNYINLSFSVKKNWSMGLAVKPYSYTDLSLASLNTTVPGDTSIYKSNFKAKGGITKLAFTNAFEIGKDFFLGIETSVLFGQIKRITDSQIQNDSQFYTVNFTEQQNYRGLQYRLGAAWRHKIKKDQLFNLGFVIEPSKNISAERLRTTQTFLASGAPTFAEDTIANSILSTKVLLPTNFKIGISLEKLLKYSIFADFAIGKNTQFVGINGKNEGFKNTYSFGVGGEYFPSFTSTKFLKQIGYRGGFNFGTSPYSHIKTGEQLKEASVAFGLALPLRNLSYINLNLIAGKRGSIANGGLSENFTKISIGFTLNDRWFQKQKID
jgi:hypothetical protein